MSRNVIALTLTSFVLAGALFAGSLALRPAPAMADAASTTTMAQPTLDAKVLGPIIRQYLLDHPEILQEMSDKLQAKAKAAQMEKTKSALAQMHNQIYNDPANVVVGNPKGDVTLVEMFDYNCTYCRAALPDLAKLIASDPNLKVILKEFPILSQGSVEAARVAVAVNQLGGDYWKFHTTLFSSRGQVTKQTALDAAKSLGLDMTKVEQIAQSDATAKVIQRSYNEAQALSISGTPAYIIGDQIIPGAVGEASLKKLIGNMRSCGSTVC